MSKEDQDPSRAATQIRLDLKQWEKAFAIANAGRKPGRDDIKKDATIAAKYKTYERLRRSSEKLASAESPRRRRSEDVLRETSANIRTTPPRTTPSKTKKTVLFDSNVLSPAQEVEPTPAFIRCALGPTPQKDGQVLGIFDMLGTENTPSKSGEKERAPIVCGTPTKKPTSTPSESALSKTPQSSGQRFYLQTFAGTPLKRKRDDEATTPSTISKWKDAITTPAFLSRTFSLGTINEDEPADHRSTTLAPPFKKRGLVRSLSSIIQKLRKQEEKKMDDDWDILNEIESEERGEMTQRHQQKKKQKKDELEVLVEEIQEGDMPLGPDQAEANEDAEVEDGDAANTVRKPWKKKGLKRQTRRVNMRPVLHNPKKADDLSHIEDSGTEGEAVAETQPREDGQNDSTTTNDGEGGLPGKKNDGRAKKSKLKDNGDAVPGKTTEKQTKPRKISAQSHANFRRLNIKNKNSKGRGRGRR